MARRSYSAESVERALEHHRRMGAIQKVERRDDGRFVVDIIGAPDMPAALTLNQAHWLAIGLATGERHCRERGPDMVDEARRAQRARFAELAGRYLDGDEEAHPLVDRQRAGYWLASGWGEDWIDALRSIRAARSGLGNAGAAWWPGDATFEEHPQLEYRRVDALADGDAFELDGRCWIVEARVPLVDPDSGREVAFKLTASHKGDPGWRQSFVFDGSHTVDAVRSGS